MPEKVAVDILDIDGLPSPSGGGASPEEEAPRGAGTGQTVKLLVAGFFTALIFSAGGYVLWTNLSVPTADMKTASMPEAAGKTEASAPASAVPIRAAEMEGFVVDMTDGKGASRIVLCGLALDMDVRQASLVDRDIECRRIIYEALRSRKVESLMTSEGRNSVKKEIRELLMKRTGIPEIRDVYFTKFVVL
jgi:flagellar basal body-associated protein FliL